MATSDELRSEVRKIFQTQWTERDGRVVPESSDLPLSNEGVRLEAAVLYADLAQSTQMVDAQSSQFAAEVYKTYLHCAAKIVRTSGGTVVAYDGDRVMGVFIGDSKRTNAAKAALRINWAVVEIVNPELKNQYPDRGFVVRQAVGVDVGKLLVARTGVRGANDLVWVGRAANYAAKLCALRSGSHASFITKEVFDQMHNSAKFASDGRPMWQSFNWTEMGARTAYRSTWRWKP